MMSQSSLGQSFSSSLKHKEHASQLSGLTHQRAIGCSITELDQPILD